MASNFLCTKLSLFPHLFQPTRDAIFSFLPFKYRWRLLALQPLNLLSLLITSPSWLTNNQSSVLYIPSRSGPKRCLVYQPPPEDSHIGQEQDDQGRKLRPLHIGKLLPPSHTHHADAKQTSTAAPGSAASPSTPPAGAPTSPHAQAPSSSAFHTALHPSIPTPRPTTTSKMW